MRIDAVEAVVAFGSADFQDFANILEQVHGFVNRSKTGGGEIGFDLLIDLLDAGMVATAQEDRENRYPLRGDPAATRAQHGEDGVEAIPRFWHDLTTPAVRCNP